jgi:hypothetical protein
MRPLAIGRNRRVRCIPTPPNNGKGRVIASVRPCATGHWEGGVIVFVSFSQRICIVSRRAYALAAEFRGAALVLRLPEGRQAGRHGRGGEGRRGSDKRAGRWLHHANREARIGAEVLAQPEWGPVGNFGALNKFGVHSRGPNGVRFFI